MPRASASRFLLLPCVMTQLVAAVARAESPAAGTPSVLPADVRLVYETTGNTRIMGLPMTLHARTTTQWHREGERYESHLHMDTVGFDQYSYGRAAADGVLAPDRYTEKRPFHSPDEVRVDWEHRQITFGGAPPATAPEPGAQDRLSLQFELARQCRARADAFVPGSVYAVRLIGTHDVDPWKFTVSQDPAVETGRGRLTALRFSARRTVGAVEETMDIWLAASVYWMPVRIRIVDRNQSVIDSVLQSVDPQ